MRHIILIVALTTIALSASAQQMSDEQIDRFEHNQEVVGGYIDELRNQDDITVVEIGKMMTKVLAIKLFEQGDDDSAKLLRSIDSIEIVVDSGSKGDKLSKGIFSLPDECQGFELISSVDTNGELIRFYFADHSQSKKCEFLMLVRSQQEAIMLYITGEFSIADISSLSSLSEGMIKK